MPRDYELTEEQLNAINSNENMVITACPGSGKTTVIVEKIRKELNELPSYQGVIGITFTQKSAKELKDRCKKDSFDIKSTFLGTIDHFCLQEIIYPFISRIYGITSYKIECKSYRNIDEEFKEDLPQLNDVGTILKTTDYSSFEHIFRNHYQNGFIMLEAVGIIANKIIETSISCQRYLKARYTSLYIDEYQDSSEIQHKLFLNIYELGLKAVAVGDINQSIYAWRGSNPEYIQELISQSDVFEHHIVNINHRCHVSISNYSNRLLNENCQIVHSDDLRIYQFQMIGTQVDVANELNTFIPQIMDVHNIENYSDIAILVNYNKSLEYLKDNITLPYKIFDDDILLIINTSVSKLLYELLVYRLNENVLINDVLETLRGYDFSNKSTLKKDREKIQEIRTCSDRRLKSKLIRLVSQLINEALTERENEVLLIGGGIGISSIRTLFERFARSGRDVVLVYSAHEAGDLVLKSEIDALAALFSNAKVFYLARTDGITRSDIQNGRFSVEYLVSRVFNVPGRQCFISGPPAMASAAKAALIRIGVPGKKIYVERFSYRS